MCLLICQNLIKIGQFVQCYRGTNKPTDTKAKIVGLKLGTNFLRSILFIYKSCPYWDANSFPLVINSDMYLRTNERNDLKNTR